MILAGLLARVGFGAVSRSGWLVILVVLVISAGSAGWVAWNVCTWRWESKREDALAQAVAEKEAAQQHADQLARDYLAAKDRRRIVYREVIREVPKFIDRDNCRVTDDGMRQLACAIDPAKCAAERGTTLPTATAAARPGVDGHGAAVD